MSLRLGIVGTKPTILGTRAQALRQCKLCCKHLDFANGNDLKCSGAEVARGFDTLERRELILLLFDLHLEGHSSTRIVLVTLFRPDGQA